MPRKSRYENTAVKDELNIKAPGTLAAVYARISVDDGDSEIDESISNQQKIIHAFLQTHHSISLIDTYIDNGYSGMNYNRPGFQKMLLDINKGKINCVIVKDDCVIKARTPQPLENRHFLRISAKFRAILRPQRTAHIIGNS